jgi:hypothetical protein
LKNQTDEVLAQLMNLVKSLDMDRLELCIRADGRIYASIETSRGYVKHSINCEIDEAHKLLDINNYKA